MKKCIYLDKETWKNIKENAEWFDVPESAFINQAIRFYTGMKSNSWFKEREEKTKDHEKFLLERNK